MATLIEDLRGWCLLANRVAYDMDGVRNTCIHTSMALAEFLRRQDLDAEVFRAKAGVDCLLHDKQCYGAVAGSDGDGTRRPKSNGWHGHLAVSCGDFVLDPTIDQLETKCDLRPAPAVFLKPEGWDVVPPDRPWQGGSWHHWEEDGLDVSHVRHPRQMGWKSKPAARPSRWLDMVEAMVEVR